MHFMDCSYAPILRFLPARRSKRGICYGVVAGWMGGWVAGWLGGWLTIFVRFSMKIALYLVNGAR